MDAFQGLLTKLSRIPHNTRVFDITASAALRRYGISPDILTALVDQGFPVLYKSGEAHYEISDLINLSLQLNQGSIYRVLTHMWPRALARLDNSEKLNYRLGYVAACPDDGHALCHFRILTPSQGYVEMRRQPHDHGPLHNTEISLRSAWPNLPEPTCALIRGVSNLELFWLPAALDEDVDFMLGSGLANCRGVARLLMAEGARLGLSVRPAYGFLMAPPYATTHRWVEIEVDGESVPVDPLMINALLRWNVVDPRRWNPYRSLGGVLCRLSCQPVPVVTHDGRHVAASFPVRHLGDRKEP